MDIAQAVLSGLVGAIVAAMVTCGIGVLIRQDEIRKSDLDLRLKNLREIVSDLLASQNIMNECVLQFVNTGKSQRTSIESLVVTCSALHSQAVASRKSAVATSGFLNEKKLASAIAGLAPNMEAVISQIMQYLGGEIDGHGKENEKWIKATNGCRVTIETVYDACKGYEEKTDMLIGAILGGMRAINKNRNDTDIFSYLHRA